MGKEYQEGVVKVSALLRLLELEIDAGFVDTQGNYEQGEVVYGREGALIRL